MDKDDALQKFNEDMQTAVDWAIDNGLTVDDMLIEVRELVNTMEQYPEEFRPIG